MEIPVQQEQKRGRGRPPGADARVTLSVRVKPALRARLEALAVANHRSPSQEAERLMLLGLQAEEGHRNPTGGAPSETENDILVRILPDWLDDLADKVADRIQKKDESR